MRELTRAMLVTRGAVSDQKKSCWFEVINTTVVNKDGQSGRRDTLAKRDDVM